MNINKNTLLLALGGVLVFVPIALISGWAIAAALASVFTGTVIFSLALMQRFLGN